LAAEHDASTVDVLMQAAADVVALAPSVAIELYRRVLALSELDDDRRLDIEVACLEPLARAGDIDVARARAEALFASARDEEQRQRIHAGFAAVLATAGDLTSSTRHYHEAETNEETRAAEQCLATGQRVLLGDDPAQIAVDLSHVLATTNDPHVECAAHQGLALTAGALCRFDLAAAHALESFRRFDPRTMPRAGFLIPDVWVASVDAFRDRFDDATLLFERVGYEAERRGELSTLVHTSAALGLVAFFAGKWDDAVSDLDAVLTLADETGAKAHLVTAHAGLAGIALGRGERDDARGHLAAGHDAMRTGLHLFGVDLLLWVSASEAFGTGDVDGAYAQLSELWHLTGSMRGLTQFRSIAPDLVRAALATGHRAEAAAAVAEVEACAGTCPVASLAAAARRCRAMLADDAQGAVAAAELLDSTPWRLDHARSCEEAAALLAASGRTEQARELADSAAIEFAHIGALVASERLVQTYGLVRQTYPDTAWDALSPRELEVAELVSAGLSNPEIAQRLYISRRTVESHVASAIRKLGASNRTQIATRAVERRAGEVERRP